MNLIGNPVSISISDDVSFTRAISTPPTPPPADWTFCAAEGGVCAFTGTLEVRYGANGSFIVKTLTDGTACTNALFGDPAPGTPKQCGIRTPSTPPMEWTFCAPEAACAPSTARLKCATGRTARSTSRH